MPILNVSLDLQGMFTVVDQSQVHYDIQFQNLSLKFDVGVDGGPANNAAADSSSVTANYDATFQGSIPMMPNLVTGNVKGGSSISVSDFKLSRYIQEDLPELNESDGGTDQSPGTVAIAGTLHLDGMKYTVQPPPGISMPQASGVTSFNVPFVAQATYDAGETSQKNDVSTSGGDHTLQASGKAQIDCRNATLEMQAIDTDLTTVSGIAGNQFPQHPSPYLASDPASGSYLVHGNIIVTPRVDGGDWSEKLSTLRRMREWAWSLQAGGAQESSVARRGKLIGNSTWNDDNLTGKTSWLDVPGGPIVSGPNGLPAQRFLQEFIWGVANWQCFKYLYFIVVTDTKPGWYRSRISQAIPIDKATYKEITKNAPQPYKTEDQVSFAADSTWLPVQDASQPSLSATQAK